MRHLRPILVAATVLAWVTAVHAQTPQDQPRRGQAAGRGETVAVAPPAQSAEETRDELARVLEQYPPTLGQVLRIDPSLLNNHDYLGLYPALSSFIERHPEVAHNPSFFFGSLNFRGRGFYFEQASTSRTDIVHAIENVMAGLLVLIGIISFLSLLTFLLKTLIEHRRWLRISKIQTDAHSKLLDRLTSNEDLLAYIQSPAGRQFLEGTPVATTAPRQALSAPVNRILWSVQVGVVLALGGAGLWWARGFVIEDVAQPLAVFGVLIMSLGAGFVLSALVAYGLSRALGLFDPAPIRPHA